MARRQEVDLTALGFNSSADGHSHASRPVLVLKKKLGMNTAGPVRKIVSKKDLKTKCVLDLFSFRERGVTTGSKIMFSLSRLFFLI